MAIKVGDIIYSNYFGTQIKVSRIASDTDWSFIIDGQTEMKAQTPLSWFENHPPYDKMKRSQIDFK